ncbi:MAG: PAS domain S-box protein [Verrucomicrobiia bacterium]
MGLGLFAYYHHARQSAISAQETVFRRLGQAIEAMETGFAVRGHDRKLVLSNRAHRWWREHDPKRDTPSEFDAHGRDNREELEVEGRWIEKYEAQTDSGDSVEIISDISERIRGQQALAESEARYRTVLEVSPVGIIVHDGGRVVFANSASAAVFGAESAEKLIGTNMVNYFPPEDLKFVGVGNTAPEMIEDAELTEGLLRKLDGTEIEVARAVALMTWDERPSTLVVVRDISRAQAGRARITSEPEGSRSSERGKVGFSGDHESRNPDANERCYRIDERPQRNRTDRRAT